MRTIIIDGYNVLLGIGMLKLSPTERELPKGRLQQARERFLGALSTSLPKEVRNQIVIIFDSAMRLPELPDQYIHNGMDVRFASGHADADELIIQWLNQHSSPKQVLAVSSDHQIQTAASRRKAKFSDAEPWYDQFVEGGGSVSSSEPEAELRHQDEKEVTWDQETLEVELNFAGESSKLPDDDRDVEQWLEDFDQEFQNEVSGKVQSKGSKNSFQMDQLQRLPNEIGTPNETNTEADESDDEKRLPGSEIESPAGAEKDSVPVNESEVSGEPTAEIEDSISGELPIESGDARRDIEGVDENQIKRWSRQLDQHTTSPFPPGYGEDLLFGQPLPSNDPRDRWEREQKKRQKKSNNPDQE